MKPAMMVTRGDFCVRVRIDSRLLVASKVDSEMCHVAQSPKIGCMCKNDLEKDSRRGDVEGNSGFNRLLIRGRVAGCAGARRITCI